MKHKELYATIRIDPAEGEPVSGAGTKVFAVLNNGEEALIPGLKSVSLSIGVDSPPTAILRLVDWSMSPTKARVSLNTFDDKSKRKVKRYGAK